MQVSKIKSLFYVIILLFVLNGLISYAKPAFTEHMIHKTFINNNSTEDIEAHIYFGVGKPGACYVQQEMVNVLPSTVKVYEITDTLLNQLDKKINCIKEVYKTAKGEYFAEYKVVHGLNVIKALPETDYLKFNK